VESSDKEPLSELSEADFDAVSQESARQELDEYLESLQEREKGLKVLEEAQQDLEDQLEDANTEVDRLRRELDKAMVEAEESEYLRQEAEGARKQLENTLYSMQEGVENSKVTDLRDERMHRRQGVLGIDAVTRGPFVKGVFAGILMGVVSILLILEVLALFNGKGELISLLLSAASG
jgi:chromosome segregation ATPase